MKKRIIAAAVSILLAVSFILSLPVTVKADTWEETIDRYDQLFSADTEPAAMFKELYKVFLSDPRTFTNQLAFRDKETKEYVLQILTGDWVTPEQLENMEAAIRILLSYDFYDVSQTELHLWHDMMDHFTYLELRDIGVITDCSKLFLQVAAIENDYDYRLAPSLAYAIIGTPDVFLRTLLEEEETVQERTILMLGFYNTDFIGAKICNSLPEYSDDAKPELAALRQEILLALRTAPQLPIQADPDPKELQQWQVEGYFPQLTTTYRYSGLLNIKLGVRAETFVEALLTDTEKCINELAFRDVETKRALLYGIAETYIFPNTKLRQISFHLQAYLEEADSLTKSEIDLLEAYIYYLDYFYYLSSPAHRDFEKLFAEAVDHPFDARINDFCDELKLAFIDYPDSFIYRLAQEEEAVQDAVARYLCADSETSDALLNIVASTLASERKRWTEHPDSFTEEEYALLVRITDNIQMLPAVPEPSDPDPEEYAQWLKANGLLVDDPGVVLPIRPTETQPATLPTETQPTAGEDPEKDTGWVSTVCFTLGFLCIGIAAGSMIAKKKKAKKAAQAEKQAAAEVPVKVYPKLLYCPAPLSRESQKQISQVLREKYDEYSIHWYSIKQPDGTCRCYGTDNGYDIIFYAGGLRMEIPDSHTVGSCTFSFATGFELYAHKDGQLTDLDAALEQGLVSHQAVQEALDKHNSISR